VGSTSGNRKIAPHLGPTSFKNMLLHSREGSGEHRPVDINALVEESLSLAWHGARAEKPGFDITLERSFDPTAGEADVFPQDVTRALLNLISNGFMQRPSARRKRMAENTCQRLLPRLKALAIVWRSGFATTAPVFRLK
jgi:two-component system, NtrC family, sensor kinase